MSRFIILISCAVLLLSAGLVFWLVGGQDDVSTPRNPSISVSHAGSTEEALISHILSAQEIDYAIAPSTEESHIAALETIMTWLREQHVLATEDQAILLDYLQQQQPESLTSGEWEERVNEILNFLRAQPKGVPGLADLMLHMAKNDPNVVLRMYAMQHIFLWIPDEPDQEKRNVMMAYLKRVAETPSDIHSGAAVMFLSDLELREGQKVDSSDEKAINRAALNLFKNAEVNTAARISALHTCTERKVTEALPTAREIAADESKMIPLRKAAIHCIGQLGAPEDIEFLNGLAMSSSNLKAAIEPAMLRLQRD